MSAPRVLVVSAFAEPATHGGLERVLAASVHHLRARGWTVDELYGTPAGGPLELFWRDYAWVRPRLPGRVLRADRALLRDAARPADVVTWWAVGGLPLRLLGASGRPEVAFVLDAWFRYMPGHDPTWRGGPFAFGPAVHPVFLSAAVQAAAGGGGEVLHVGVAPAFFAAASEPGPWRGRVLLPGRVEEAKGVHVAAEALGASLRVLGDGPPGYVERVRALGAQVVGGVYRAALVAEYERADCVVFPVLWPEPWGLVPLEAMAVGRPVVATGTGGSAEYLRDGENCLLVAPADPAPIRAAVDRLAADPALRARLVAGGRATAARYPQSAWLEGVERILARHGAAPAVRA